MRVGPSRRNEGKRIQPGPTGVFGPPRDRWAGCLAEFERDRLGFLMSARDRYGGLVAFDSNATIINEPDLAAEVFQRHHDFSVRGSFLNRRLSLGQVAQVEASRTHLNAGMRRSAVETLRGRAAAFTEDNAPVGREHVGIDPMPLAELILARSVAEFYFGNQGPEVAAAITPLLDALSDVFGNPLPAAIPTPANMRVKRRYRRVRKVVDPLVAVRVSSPQSTRDYATTVAVATQAGHDFERVVDLLIGSLLASQRVPAAAAAWTLWHLSQDTALSCRDR